MNALILGLADPWDRDVVRAPVRACVDALAAQGVTAETVTATSDQEIDQVLARLDAPDGPDGLTWPAGPDTPVRLVVATAVDAQLRAVVRRMVRRWAPPPSRRPATLPANRTVPDLPPVAVLPVGPASPGDLVGQLGLPRTPQEVAAAVVAGRVRRLDLLRSDGRTAVTLDGVLLGGTDDEGRAVTWRGTVEVDDVVLARGEPLLTALVANAGGYLSPDGLPLLTAADPADGTVEVAVAVPVRSRWRRRVRVEVRRARGRAVAVSPGPDGVASLDDGVTGAVSRRCSWWVEPGAWAVYTG